MPLRAYLVTQHRLHDPLTKMDVPVPSRIRGTVDIGHADIAGLRGRNLTRH